MNRSLLILILLFILLGAAVLLIEKPFSEPQKETRPELGVMYPNFNPEEITRMEFGTFGGQTELVNEDDTWFVLDDEKKYPADAEAVEKVLETLKDMRAEQLISQNPDKHIQFQVNGPKEMNASDDSGQSKPMTMGTLGTEVTLYDKSDTKVVDLFIGKNGSADFMTTYVRKAESDSVVLVDGYLKATFGKGSTANWKDRTLLKTDKNKLRKITIEQGESKIILESFAETDEKGDEILSWRMLEPELIAEIPESKINRLTSMFSYFLATDYAPELDETAKYGFADPELKVNVKLDDATEKTFIIGNLSEEKSKQYYVKIDDDDRIFLIPEYRVKTLQSEPADFKPDESETIGENTVSG